METALRNRFKEGRGGAWSRTEIWKWRVLKSVGARGKYPLHCDDETAVHMSVNTVQTQMWREQFQSK
jgi:hypothetical protein